MNPALTETEFNGIDDDCDGVVDTDVDDADRDGYTPAAGDCEGEDPESYPGAPETPDGVDNDCDGYVDEGTTAYDDDGDGFAEEDGDCNDSDIDTSPESDDELDGVDNDCDGAVDGGTSVTDDDRDGFSEDAGDCDDFNDKRTPGAEEIPYDGYDNDCDGADVVDADQDGYPGITKATYLALNPDAVWPDSVIEGPLDCADDPVAQPFAANVFPGNPNEVPYDGVDADCGQDNDFDRDGDGYMPDTASDGSFDTYVTNWGYTSLVAQYGDCDDTTSSVYTGALEGFADGLDSDCDGESDGTPFGFNGYIWDSPRPPRVDGAAGRYILVTSATAATTSG